MKRLILFFLTAIALSCNNEGKASKDAMADSKATTVNTSDTKMNYPYSIERPDNWDVGSTGNTMTALASLKAWEDGKMDESLQYFGDSVLVHFDGMTKKMSNDSLKAFFKAGYNNYKTVKVKMSDWMSVVSKDKNEEWVTLWYTQHSETKQGTKDSINILNDLQLKNGKIVRIDEYTRKLH